MCSGYELFFAIILKTRKTRLSSLLFNRLFGCSVAWLVGEYFICWQHVDRRRVSLIFLEEIQLKCYSGMFFVVFKLKNETYKFENDDDGVADVDVRTLNAVYRL